MKLFRRRSVRKPFAAGLVALAFALAMLGVGGGGALAANDPSACPQTPVAGANPGAEGVQTQCQPPTSAANEAGVSGSTGEATAPNGTASGGVASGGTADGATTGGSTGGTTAGGTTGGTTGDAGEIQACVITANGSNGAPNVVVIAPGQSHGQTNTGAQTAPPPVVATGAAAGPATASSSDQAGTAGTCENGTFAPIQGAAGLPAAQVCSISGATGAATPGSVPAGPVIVVGNAQFCATMTEGGDSAASETASDNCVNLAPAAIQNPAGGSTTSTNDASQSAPAGSVIVIGSTLPNPVAANGDVHVCTGDTVNIAPATAASGSTCTISLPDGSTSAGVVIIANGALNCMGNAAPTNAPAAPSTSGSAPANATAGAPSPGTATQTP
jgi:hypothetical protein